MKIKRSAKRAKKREREGQNKARRVRVWRLVGMVVGAALVAGGVWWVAQQPLPEIAYLRVNEIEIRGNDHVATEEILSRLGSDGPVNYLQSDMEQLAGRVTAHPWIQKASIQRDPSLRLVVTVEERQPVAFLAAEKTYLLSADAVILEEVKESSTHALPTLRPQWRAKYRVGGHLNEPRILGGLALLEGLRKAPPFHEVQVKEVTVEADGNYILHLAGGGAILRLGETESLPQLHRLDVALRRHGQGLESLAYVDLRFPGRVILNPSEKGG